jgi:hypothetical protein
MKKEQKHETDYIKKYQEEGYTANFLFENGCLLDSETKYAYKPEEIFIVAHHRYEGMSDPDDMSILYVIETGDQKKRNSFNRIRSNGGFRRSGIL